MKRIIVFFVVMCLFVGISNAYADSRKPKEITNLFDAVGMAVWYGEFNYLEDMLANGANPNEVKYYNNVGISLLAHASRINYGYTVSGILLGPIKRNRWDERTLKTLKMLYEAGARPQEGIDDNILFGPAQYGYAKSIEFLIQIGADVNARVDRKTALSIAYFSRKKNVQKILLKYGAEPLTNNEMGIYE